MFLEIHSMHSLLPGVVGENTESRKQGQGPEKMRRIQTTVAEADRVC